MKEHDEFDTTLEKLIFLFNVIVSFIIILVIQTFIGQRLWNMFCCKLSLPKLDFWEIFSLISFIKISFSKPLIKLKELYK